MNIFPASNSNLYALLKFGAILLILLLWLTMIPAPLL
jgi:hypothetical protein